MLNGPSRTGKTQFAINLFGITTTLEVNCASADHPPLRAFSRNDHKCIVLDGTSTSMVVTNKRLFQSPNCQVIIGLSPTNMNAYPVYLNDAALIICTNTWHHELSAMKDADAQWLRKNMVFIDVQGPPGEGRACSHEQFAACALVGSFGCLSACALSMCVAPMSCRPYASLHRRRQQFCLGAAQLHANLGF